MSEAESGEDKAGRFRLLSKLRRPFLTLVVLLLLSVAFNTAAGWMSARWDAGAARNPETGILIGAEELDLGPRDASTGVLLVHGFVGGSNNFWELPERLAASGVRVRALRLPGHGTSPKEFAGTPSGDFLPAVLREVRGLKGDHEKVVVIGHSMGGALSVLSASIEEVDGLVLGAPYFGVTYQWYYVVPAEYWSGLTGPFLKWMYRTDDFVRVKRVGARREILAYRWIPSKGTSTLISIGKRARDPFVLEQISCPVLMLHSKDDFAASPVEAELAFDRIASENKRLVWLNDTDHQIFWDYDRDRVLEEVIAFVEEIRNSA